MEFRTRQWLMNPRNPKSFVVIEDELAIRRFLKASLSQSSKDWHEAGTGAEGIKLVALKDPDVVLLDLGLPDMDGLEVLTQLREWSKVPIIVLSARGQERDKVDALDGGADDYLTKPFSVGELMARIRVAMRRSEFKLDEIKVFESEGLKVDFVSKVVSIKGEEIRLTQTERKLLYMLVQNAGKVITQNQMLREVWGEAYEDSTHTLRVHMGNLRQKLESKVDHPLIRTETGIGYRFIGG